MEICLENVKKHIFKKNYKNPFSWRVYFFSSKRTYLAGNFFRSHFWRNRFYRLKNIVIDGEITNSH